MEAQIPPPSITARVLGSLRSVAGPGKSKFIAATHHRASSIQSSADELDVYSKSRFRRSWLATTNRGYAAGTLSAGRAASMSNGPRS